MEAYQLFFIAGLVMLCSAPLLLISIMRVDQQPVLQKPHEIGTRQQSDAFQPKRKFKPGGAPLNTWRLLRDESRHLANIARQLRLAGINSSADQMKYLGAGIVAAILLGGATVALMMAREIATAHSLLYALIVVVTVLMLENYTLKRYAERRQKRIEHESMMLIQTLRMLWRVGLSLPKTLSILCDELRLLTPESARELGIVAQRIEAGESQDEALYELSNNTVAEGFKELLIILRQESMTGGGIDRSLQDLYKLLQSKRKTELQEKVSKMSGKMSMVMMLFLFPAMIIVIGGPGFIAISRAISNMSGG